MKLKNHIVLFILVIFLVSGTVTNSYSQDSKQLFQKGLMKENGEGDLHAAIKIYEEVVADENAENSVKAKAQLHIGLCYEKMGKEEAIKAYELVIQNYKNYKDEVQLASLRLSELIMDEGDEDFFMINLYEKGANFRDNTMLDNASLSPDGSKLVGIDYSLGQNVATYNLQTKEIELITNYNWTTPGHGWTYFPCWSPDGKKVAYLYSDWNEGKGGDYEIKISTLGGESRTILINKAGEGQFIPRQWSKDGENILTGIQDTAGHYSIALVSVSDGAVTPLYNTQWEGSFIKGDACLSPDGKHVVFVDGPPDNMDLYIIDVEGGAPSVLSNYPTNELEPLWSPDGGHIVYIKETKGEAFLYGMKMVDGKSTGQPLLLKEGMQNISLMNWTDQGICGIIGIDLHDIYTMPIDPETNSSAGKPIPLDYTPTGSNTNPIWSHDGKYFAFISYTIEPKVVVISLDNGEMRHYPIKAPGFWELSLWDLRWLPDNSGLSFSVKDPLGKIVVYRLDIPSGKWKHWILPIDGWTRTESGPDENSLIYSVFVPKPMLFHYNTETGKTNKIFQTSDTTWHTIRALKFSRDHTKLVFMTDYKGIMLFDLTSGESKLVSADYYSPTFSPDGQKILTFGRFEDGEKQSKGAIILSLEGEILNQFDIMKYFTSGTTISSTDWSPDGKQITFMTRNLIFETYLMKNVLK